MKTRSLKNLNLYPRGAPGVGGQQSTTNVARNTSLRERFQPLETGVTTGTYIYIYTLVLHQEPQGEISRPFIGLLILV